MENGSKDAPFHCRICGATTLDCQLLAKEMMYGTGNSFIYDKCADCGSLQISTIPDNLPDYYPKNYYSMSGYRESVKGLSGALKSWLAAASDRSLLGRGHLIGTVVGRFRAPAGDIAAIAALRLPAHSRILDVGCGAAAVLLRRLESAGFTNLVGVDPFIPADCRCSDTLQLLKLHLEEMEGQFDLVMFNHSFEHLPNPRAALSKARSLLAPGGRCIIRVPTVSSEAFRRYRHHWVQLDAPRHLTLPSRRGLQQMMNSLGMQIFSQCDDSSAFQFVGSELYRSGVPLLEQDSHRFSKQQINAFTREALRLNEINQGDQVAFTIGAFE